MTIAPSSSDGVSPAAAMPNFMADLGLRLVENGFPILPIMPGAKCPGRFVGGRWVGHTGWQQHCQRPTKPFEVNVWKAWPGCGIGVACGQIVALDIDLMDEGAALEIEAMARAELGDTPALRIGRAPKRLLVYRADRPFKPIKRHPVELLATGNQFVAYAIHPDTGLPYAWPHEGLDELHVSRLPVVGEAQAQAFMDAAAKLVPAELKQSRLGPDRSAEYYFAPGGEQRGTVEAVTAALDHLHNDDLPYDDWIRIGLAIKGALGEAGAALWCDWSARSSKDVPATTLKAWRSFKPDRIGAGSIYYFAGQFGWVPPADMILNGALAEAVAAAPAQAMLDRLAAKIEPTPAAAPEPEPEPGIPAGTPDVAAIVAAAPGALGRMVEWMVATAVSPQPLLSLGAALCAYGTAMGRRYKLDGPDTRSNIYVIALADSGGGKDHPRRCVRRAMMEAGLGAYLGGETLASGSAVMASVAAHPCRLFQIDEFGHFVQAVLDPKSHAWHRREIMTNLTTLWSSASETVIGTEYANQRERPRQDIVQPCVSVYGSTVPQTFWAALQSGNIGDGSIARFLLLPTPQNYPDERLKPEPVEERLAAIVADMKAVAAGADGHAPGNVAAVMAANVAPEPFAVPLSPEAAALDLELRGEHLAMKRQHEGTPLSAVVARFREQTRRVALVAAVADNPAAPLLEARHLAWAADLVRWSLAILLEQARRHVADSEHEAMAKRLLEIIRKHGGWIDGNTLSNKARSIPRKLRADLLADLVEGGDLEVKQERTSTKPRTMLRAARRD